MRFLTRSSGFLIPKENFLEDVNVGNGQAQTFGILNAEQTMSFSGERVSNKCEIATLINIPEQIKRYKISKVYIKQKNVDKDRPMRLHLYSIDNNGLPNIELLKEDIVISQQDISNGVIQIDLHDQNIILENTPFFIGVQWLLPASGHKISGQSFKKDFGSIGITDKIKDSLTFQKTFFTQYKWRIIYANSFNAKNKNINPINALMSADIEPLK